MKGEGTVAMAPYWLRRQSLNAWALLRAQTEPEGHFEELLSVKRDNDQSLVTVLLAYRMVITYMVVDRDVPLHRCARPIKSTK